MKLAEKWLHSTKFTGQYPDTLWSGYTFLDYHKSLNVYHPGVDYNFGYGNQDLGQDVVATASGTVIHTSKSTKGYGNIIVIKHQLGYNLKRFIKQQYGIDTDILYSFYAHLKGIDVSTGTNVESGIKIGTVGKSGTTWAHLHFEIYAPIGELVKKGWRYYPIGWSKEKIKQYWLPAYTFIEASRQMDYIADTFLGKSRKYWETVELDRKNLMKQIGEVDSVWAKKLEKSENKVSNLEKELLRWDGYEEKVDKATKKLKGDFEKERVVFKNKIKTKENRITELLKEEAKKVSFWEALRIVVYTLHPSLKKKGGEDQ